MSKYPVFLCKEYHLKQSLFRFHIYLLPCNLFFFFKQKTAYEILRCLVGSEMCIRDRLRGLGLDHQIQRVKLLCTVDREEITGHDRQKGCTA